MKKKRPCSTGSRSSSTTCCVITDCPKAIAFSMIAVSMILRIDLKRLEAHNYNVLAATRPLEKRAASKSAINWKRDGLSCIIIQKATSSRFLSESGQPEERAKHENNQSRDSYPCCRFMIDRGPSKFHR
eukprot:scpid37110/ scgid24754/ 